MTEQFTVLNMNTLKATKNAMNERFPLMIKYFFEDTEMYMSEIEKGVIEKDAEIALPAAHTIRSAAKQLGAENVSEKAKHIEVLCREILNNTSSDYSKLKTLCMELKVAIEAAVPELNKISFEIK